MFSNGIVHWGREIIFFALTIFIRDHFSLNLDEEAGNLMTEYFLGWIEERSSKKNWKSIQFYVGLACAVFSVNL